MICVSISDPADLPAAFKSSASWLEFRLDLMGPDVESYFIHSRPEQQIIATCRPEKTGLEERRRRLAAALEAGAAYLDLELESAIEELQHWKEKIREAGAGLIISYHNFKLTPAKDELEAILLSAYEKGADIAKLACHARDEDDVRKLLAVHELPGRKVVLGMGVRGRVLRLVAPFIGSEFSFAAMEGGRETAPGQFALQELQEIYTKLERS